MAAGDDAKSRVLGLMQEKEMMEGRIQALDSKLKEMGVGRSGGLVDEEGFPLKDLDLIGIRTDRAELNCIPMPISFF